MFGFGRKKDDAVVEAVRSKVRPLFAILEQRLGGMPAELLRDPYLIGYVIGSANIFAQVETSGKASSDLRGRAALAAMQAAFASLNITVPQATAAMQLMAGSDEAKRGVNAADLVIGIAAGLTDRDTDPMVVAAKKAVADMPPGIREMLGGNDRSLLMNELQEQVFFRPLEARYGAS